MYSLRFFIVLLMFIDQLFPSLQVIFNMTRNFYVVPNQISTIPDLTCLKLTHLGLKTHLGQGWESQFIYILFFVNENKEYQLGPLGFRIRMRNNYINGGDWI